MTDTDRYKLQNLITTHTTTLFGPVTMSSSRRSSRQAAAASSSPQLPVGVETGLMQMVTDHQETVAKMLNCDETTTTTHILVKRCAVIMKQQQLSASQFLARFFDQSILQQHAVDALGKSGKGSAAVLGERIETEWRRNKIGSSDRKRNGATDSEQHKGSKKRTKTANLELEEEKEITEFSTTETDPIGSSKNDKKKE